MLILQKLIKQKEERTRLRSQITKLKKEGALTKLEYNLLWDLTSEQAWKLKLCQYYLTQQNNWRAEA